MDGFSPTSSPQRGSRSPMSTARSPMGAGINEQAGPLKMSIALGHKPAIIQKGPFYLMKTEPIALAEVTGATNLMASKNLEHPFVKLASKKIKDSLSSFLPHLPGIVDSPGSQDNSSLRGIIEKPPVGGKELMPLNQLQMAGFRLHPGPLPDQYRSLLNQVQAKARKKQKKHKHRGGETPGGETPGRTDEEEKKRKDRKHKKHDRESEEKRKKKKEKKKKKNKEDKDM